MQSAPSQIKEMTFQKSFIPFEQLRQISNRDKAYVGEDPRLRSFYKYSPNLDSFEQIIMDKQNDSTDRELLISVLNEQYQTFETSKATQDNILSLSKDSTFTIITAHQPSLFTGPSYFIYKICSVLNLTQQLNAKHSKNHFVPVFIMGGEDHDFEEISSTQIYGKKITWENEVGGSVGKLKNDTLKEVLDTLKNLLGDRPISEEIYKTIHTAFTTYQTYGEGMRFLVNALFGSYGLVVVDMSDKKLKQAFIPCIEKEIFERKSVNYITETVKELEKAGFSNQAFPREINFFYLGEGYRERIILDGDKFSVNNQDITFSESELREEIKNNPDRFSPNVNMRPIFQEFTFPNLAYIGGGGELAYWMERKSQFEYFGINYPMLIRRNSVLIIDKGNEKKLNKLFMPLESLLQEDHLLVSAFLEEHSKNELSLATEKESIKSTFDQILESTKKIDKSLIATVQAECAKQLKAIDNLEARLKKAEKGKFDTGINQIKSVKEKLFPNNGLQERKENFLTFYTKYGQAYFDYLVESLDPFQKGLMVIRENPSEQS